MEERGKKEQMPDKFPIVFLIGRGSRLPNILERILTPDSPISVPLVVSHKKPEKDKEDVIGIAEAKKRGIPAIYWNLVQMNAANRRASENHDDKLFRANYMRMLGSYLSQENYRPNLIFMTGWDLVLDENFMRFFQKENIPVLNVHPHPLPGPKQPQDEIEAPDGTKIPVLRGTEVWAKAVERGLAWSGVTIHRVIPTEFDVGPVVAREWVRIEPDDTATTLRQKLNEVEDRIVPETILAIAKGEVKLTS